MSPRPSIRDRLPGSVVPVAARPYQGRTAGLVTRSVAAAADALVVLAVVLGGYLGLNGLVLLVHPRGFTFLDTGLLLSLTACWVVALLYLTGCWCLTGRTYGCRLMGLLVMGRRGGRLRWWTAFARAACCTVLPIGLLGCAWSPRNRSLQDLLVGSRVVYEWQPRWVPTSAEQSSPQGDALERAADDGGAGATRKD